MVEKEKLEEDFLVFFFFNLVVFLFIFRVLEMFLLEFEDEDDMWDFFESVFVI